MLLVSNGKGLANTLQCNIMQEVPGNASGWYPHTEWGLDAVVTLSQDYEARSGPFCVGVRQLSWLSHEQKCKYQLPWTGQDLGEIQTEKNVS